MWPLRNLVASDAGVMVFGALLLTGWLAGMLTTVAILWRRITTPSRADEIRILRQSLADTRDQVRDLLAQNDRLARMIGVAPVRGARRQDTRTGAA